MKTTSKTPLVLTMVVLALTPFTQTAHAQLYKLNQPALSEVALNIEDTLAVQASSIEVINAYKDNKYTGDYAKAFAVLPDETLANYAQDRLEPALAGQTDAPKLFFVIDKASVIFNQDISRSTEQDRYFIEYDVRVVYGDTLENPLSEERVKIGRQLTQIRDILTKQQRADGQAKFVTALIEDFDTKLRKKL